MALKIPFIVTILLTLFLLLPMVAKTAAAEGKTEKCAWLKSEIERREADLTQSKPKVDQVKIKLEKLAVTLENTRNTLDLNNIQAVAAYNENVQLYSTKVIRYELLQEMFNKKLDGYKQLISRFNQECIQ